MTECCRARGYERVFTSRQARRDAARFRNKGLTWAPRRAVELYRDGTFSGHTLLEVGGGIGDLQIELLRSGMRRATSVEVSGAYEATATRLLDAAGLAGRSRRIVGDFAAMSEPMEPADVVVLLSVVCCYHDAGKLLAAAAASARHHVVLSYPRAVWWLRAWARVQNLYPRLRSSDVRFIVHPPALIEDALERAGLRLVHHERNWIDHLAVFTRAG